MTTTVIGLFGDAEEAKKAARAIERSGHAAQKPHIATADGGRDVGAELTRRGFDEKTAGRYAGAVGNGSVLLMTRVEDDRADDVAGVIDEHGALSLEDAERSGGRPGETTLDVVQEEAGIRKQGVTQGAVRVSRRVTETPFEETVTLKDRHVEVERHPVRRELTPSEAESAFEETTEEFVESTERVVVEKKAVVVGEVTISQETEERRETVEGTVRRSDVDVERLEAAQGGRKARR